MLEIKEIKFLKRCSLYPKLLIAGLVSMLTSGFAAILFDMIVAIGSDYTNDTLRSIVDITGFGIMIAEGVIGIIALICIKVAYTNPKFQDLADGAYEVPADPTLDKEVMTGVSAAAIGGRMLKRSGNSTANSVGGAVSTAATAVGLLVIIQMGFDCMKNADAICKAYGIKVIRMKTLLLSFIFVPYVILTIITNIF